LAANKQPTNPFYEETRKNIETDSNHAGRFDHRPCHYCDGKTKSKIFRLVSQYQSINYLKSLKPVKTENK